MSSLQACFVVIPAAAALLGCSPKSEVKSSGPASPRLVELFGGESNFALLREATEVRAVRLPSRETSIKHAEAVTAPSVVLSDSQRAAAVSWLADESLYSWDIASGCIPSPGVRLDFVRDQRLVSIFVCFTCGVIQTKAEGKQVGYKDGMLLAQKLLSLMKELFPQDDVLQKL